MADTVISRPEQPPFWRNVRILRVLGQAAFVVVLAVALGWLWGNLTRQIQRQGLDLSFQFLQQRAGFGIKEGIPYSPNQTFLRAYLVAFVNTLRVAAIGILVATVLGLILGVARLSSNWLVRKIAQVYVDVIRNTPVLIQIVFLYVGVVLALPAFGGGFSVGGAAFLSNRGMAVPWVHLGEGIEVWVVFLAAALAVGAGLWRWRTRVNERTGRPHRRVLWALPASLAVAVVGFLGAGRPLVLDVPSAAERGYAGGLQLSPEYAAILIALVVYTAAFIAEIVRGSILAVDRGQKEAAQALGLTPFQQLRFVVLPQAMRIAVPPVNSQYLNLTKNSSLAIAVGYPDLMSVSRTIMNQAGRATQMLLIVMLTYLALSLLISALMNLVNRSVTRKGERR